MASIQPRTSPVKFGRSSRPSSTTWRRRHGQIETYQLIRRLQNALFGAVYEARGKSSGKDWAVKVLHKSELRKVAYQIGYLSELLF